MARPPGVGTWSGRPLEDTRDVKDVIRRARTLLPAFPDLRAGGRAVGVCETRRRNAIYFRAAVATEPPIQQEPPCNKFRPRVAGTRVTLCGIGGSAERPVIGWCGIQCSGVSDECAAPNFSGGHELVGVSGGKGSTSQPITSSVTCRKGERLGLVPFGPFLGGSTVCRGREPWPAQLEAAGSQRPTYPKRWQSNSDRRPKRWQNTRLRLQSSVPTPVAIELGRHRGRPQIRFLHYQRPFHPAQSNARATSL
jgi:hypothetical protein